MRVVAGTARGRRLVAPQGTGTRPTADRVREAVFNTLYSLGGVSEATVVDLFAGTGAMGIEALSRGAGRVVFVEHSREAVAALRENLETAGVEDRAEIVISGVERFLKSSPPSFDLAVVDPPYDFEEWTHLLEQVPADVIVIESGREVALPPGWETHKVKRYGSTVVTIASPKPSEPDSVWSSPS